MCRAMAASSSWVSTLKTMYFTPEVTRALEQLSCSAEIRKGSSLAAGVDIPTKRVSLIDRDMEDPSYVFVVVELHAISGLAALREAEKGFITSAPLVLLRSGIGITCRASCLGQTLLTTKTGDTIIVVYVRLLESELELFRAAPFAMQVIMATAGAYGPPRGESTLTTKLDLVLLGTDLVPLQVVSRDERGWKGMALRSFAEAPTCQDAVTWVMLSSERHVPRWEGGARYNPKERLCAGVIDCDFVACPGIYVSDARLSDGSIWAFRLLSSAKAFSQQLGDQAYKQRDQRSREEVVAELGRAKATASTEIPCPSGSPRSQLEQHLEDLKNVLVRQDNVNTIVEAITRIMLTCPDDAASVASRRRRLISWMT